MVVTEGVELWFWFILKTVSKHLGKDSLFVSDLDSPSKPNLNTKSVNESKSSLPIDFVAICLTMILGMRYYLYRPRICLPSHLHQGGR